MRWGPAAETFGFGWHVGAKLILKLIPLAKLSAVLMWWNEAAVIVRYIAITSRSILDIAGCFALNPTVILLIRTLKLDGGRLVLDGRECVRCVAAVVAINIRVTPTAIITVDNVCVAWARGWHVLHRLAHDWHIILESIRNIIKIYQIKLINK